MLVRAGGSHGGTEAAVVPPWRPPSSPDLASAKAGPQNTATGGRMSEWVSLWSVVLVTMELEARGMCPML